jgi:2-polyprenyl-3-methyl-5-hydroxy-6-metoxy-1,4-benzoquinol methylase
MASRQLTERLARRFGLSDAAEASELRSRIRELESSRLVLETGIHDLQAWNAELAGRISNLDRRLADVDRQLEPARRLVESSRATPGMADLKLERFDAGPVGMVTGFSNLAARVDPDDSYLAFEDTFRGSEELIRERQEIYLSLLEGHAPVLDIGCGRGELLELLAAAGIAAHGIDVDRAMLAHCRAKGLTDVELADAVSYLQGAQDASLGAIVAAQVIEHLPYPGLLELLRAAPHKLRPGGRLIVETVNPHAAHALKTFWVDPTHQHPIFPEVVLALCRLSGFPTAYVFHPGGAGDAELDRFQAGDYAVLAEVSDPG